MKHGLLVGRFQPFHNGHLHAVKFALTKVEMLWIAIGSADKSYDQ
ncbi:MAG: adenylyltransferase/cytidyltransferase family protein, partial [Thaumarchaeota archaeon]|nr:adenylyltransferase/cytidyltransferase family protein [Nitrososphaerota archaeon]